MKRILAIIGAAALLSGCSTATVPPTIQHQMIVVSPPSTLFNCPTLKSLPNPDTLTNLELADVIIKLESNNRVCAANMKGLRDYITRAQQNLESLNAK